MKFGRIDQIVEWRLCMGCGACVPRCEGKAISLVDIPERGIRPLVDSPKCERCGECVKVCPGIEVSHGPFDERVMPDLSKEWGPVLEVWEGYAADPDIRYRGSSGGAATALALFCLERQEATGVLHIGARPGAPLQNVAVLSRTREELLARTGSRYSPAAPCEKLDWIEQIEGRAVFIGKPCDVVALRKSQAGDAGLREKGALAISIFCAGTPATAGTYRVLRELGVRPEDVEELRYRGCGWPGATSVRFKGSDWVAGMTYERSWGDILSNYIQFRCRLCPDSTGEFADISCGDPWYRSVEPSEPGRSLVLARTEEGRRIIRDAVGAGYLELAAVEPDTVPASQKALLNRRRHLWGRLLVMKLLFVPAPRYRGFSLFADWMKLPIAGKLRSFAGTLKRIISRRWRQPERAPVVRPNSRLAGCAKESMNLEEVEPRCKT